MNKKQSDRSNKIIILAAILLSLLIGGGFFIFNRDKPSNLTTDANISAEDQQKAADENSKSKQDFIENNSSDSTETPPKNVSLSAKMGSNNDVVVLTKLTSIGSGTCELIVTNGSKQVTQTAEIIYQPEYSSCAGFTVAKSSLGSGSWVLKLTITSGGESTTETITYEVM